MPNTPRLLLQRGARSAGRLLPLIGILFCQTGAAALPPLRSTHYDGSKVAKINFGSSLAYDSSVPMTLEAWVYREDATRCETIISRSYLQSYWFGFCDGFLRFYRSGGVFAEATATVPSGQWRHVAASYDSKQVSFFIDGEPAGIVTLGHAGANHAGSLWLGGDPDGFNFLGNLDEVRIWMAARTQTEIQADMFRELADGPGLVCVVPVGGGDAPGLRTEVFGILPRDLVIPRAALPVRMDGQIDLTGEYAGAEELVIRYRASDGVADARAYLVYRDETFGDQNLYIGVLGVRHSLGGWSEHNSFIGINVDPDFSRDALAQTNDFRVRDWLDSSEATWGWGNGAGIFPVSPNPPPNSYWQVTNIHCRSEFVPPCMEFRINRALLGGRFGTNGLMIGHFDIDAALLDFPAPSDAEGSSPATWPQATYGDRGTALPTARIQGHVFDTEVTRPVAGHKVTLIDDDSTAELYELLTGSDGAFRFEVAVPSSHRLRVRIDDCSGCRYLGPVIGSGTAPISTNSQEVVFPGCPSGTCDYAPVDFVILKPPGAIALTSFNPSNAVPRIRLAEGPPPDELPPERVRIYGNHLHPFITVYLYSCLDLPPLSSCHAGEDYFEATVVDRAPDGTWIEVEMPPVPRARWAARWDWVIQDNWVRAGATPWSRISGFSIRPASYPLAHGFQFRNADDVANLPDFDGVFGNSAYICAGLEVSGTCLGCRLRDPLYLLYFLVYKIWLDNADGSCNGMASTSLLFARGSLDPASFTPGTYYANGLPGGAVGTDGVPFPPLPQGYDTDLCGPFQPRNLWARIRSNHGVQTSDEYIQTLLAQMTGAGLLPSGGTVSSISGDPRGVLARVRSHPAGFVVSMVPEVGRGHVVTPYAVVDGVSGRTNLSHLLIYDNNFPERTDRFIEIDTAANTFRMPIRNDPADVTNQWTGDGIYSVPIGIWLGERHAPGLITLGDVLGLLVFGDADGLYTDAGGGQWGWKPDATTIDTLPGAKAITPTGDEPDSLTTDVMLMVPSGRPPPGIQVNVRGPHYLFHTARAHRIMQVEAMAARSGDQDQVQLELDAGQLKSMRYLPQSPASNFVVRIGLAPAERERIVFTWNGLTASGGGGLQFRLRPEGRSAEYRNDSAAMTHHSLLVRTVDGPSGNSSLHTFGPFEVGPGAVHRVSLADWPTAQRLLSEVDKDQDGVFETTVELGPARAGPQPEPPTVFFGFPHWALSNAVVSPATPSGVVISQIGQTGEDGVHIQYGAADGFRVAFDRALAAQDTPSGASFEVAPTDAFGRALSRVSGTDIGAGYSTAVDFEPLGLATYTLRVYEKDRMSYEQRGRKPRAPGYEGKFIPYFQPQRVEVRSPAGEPLMIALLWDGGVGLEVPGPLGELHQFDNCTRIEVVADGASPLALDALRGLTLRFGGVPSRTITGETIEVFGAAHSGLGQALLSASGGHLLAESLGGSGEDGIRTELPDASRARARIGLPVSPTDWPVGGAALLMAVGPMYVPIGALEITRRQQDYSIRSLLAENPKAQRLRVLRAGQLVTEIDLGTQPMNVLASTPPAEIEAAVEPDLSFGTRAIWPQATSFQIGLDPPVDGDTLWWVADLPQPLPPGSLLELELRGAGPSWLQLHGLEVSQVNPVPPLMFRGFLQMPAGNSTLGLDPQGRLVVGNLTASGNDGVAIRLRPADPFTVTFDSAVSAQTAPKAGTFGLSLLSRTGHPWATVGGTNVGARFATRADFSPVESPSHTLRILNGGQLTGEFKQLQAAFYLEALPSGMTLGWLAGGQASVTFRYNQAVALEIPNVFQGAGDEFVMITERPANAANLDPAAILLTFSHLGTRIIVDEQGAPRLTAAPQIVGQTLSISWPAGNGGFILEETDQLSDAPQWSPANVQTTVADGQETAILSVKSATHFYRLRGLSP